MRWSSVLMALMAGMSLTAGCIVDGEEAGPAAAGEPTPDTYRLTVLVTDEPGGPPLSDADVRAYWDERSRVSYPDAPPLTEAVPVITVGRNRSTPDGDRMARDVTDAQGRAVLDLPPGAVVGLEVYRPGHTLEWIPAAVVGSADGGQLAVPLYKDHIVYVVDQRWGPAALSTNYVTGEPTQWLPVPVQWGATPEARAGYLARLITVRADLQWTNGLDGAGDLAIAFGESEDSHAIMVVDQNQQQYFPGGQNEWIYASRWDVEDAGVPLPKEDLFIGPGTNGAMVGPLGLPYRLEVEAVFDPNPAEPVYVPGASPVVVLGAILALAGAARVLGRQR